MENMSMELDAPEIKVEVEEPKKEVPKIEPKEVKQPAAIEIGNNGLVKAKNNSELMRYCKALLNSDMVPKRFDTPDKLFGALMFVRSLGLPDVCIRQVAMIEGTPSIFGDLPLSLIQQSKELTYFKEIWFDKEYNEIRFENKNLSAEVWGSVTFMRRGEGEIQSFSFTLDDARKSKRYPATKRDGTLNPLSPWEKYTKIMMRYNSRALGAKSLFADKINGASIAEYDSDQMPETALKDVTPKGSAADALNKVDFEKSEEK